MFDYICTFFKSLYYTIHFTVCQIEIYHRRPCFYLLNIQSSLFSKFFFLSFANRLCIGSQCYRGSQLQWWKVWFLEHYLKFTHYTPVEQCTITARAINIKGRKSSWLKGCYTEVSEDAWLSVQTWHKLGTNLCNNLVLALAWKWCKTNKQIFCNLFLLDLFDSFNNSASNHPPLYSSKSWCTCNSLTFFTFTHKFQSHKWRVLA